MREGATLGIQISMSPGGDSYDNFVVESYSARRSRTRARVSLWTLAEERAATCG